MTALLPNAPPRPRRKPHVIVLGNEKGGSGKSTTAMHVIVALLRDFHRVGSIDLDARQGSLSRYFENRRAFVAESGVALPLPEHHRLPRSTLDSASAAREEEAVRLDAAMRALAECDFIVIDTPGSDNSLSRLGHARADTLITPLNDSFLDLDLLGPHRPRGQAHHRPQPLQRDGLGAEKRRAMADGGSIDWIVMRNRLGHTEARNKRDIGLLLEALSKRIGFRLAPGFSERVIFRELFLRGLTLLDLKEAGIGISLTMSHLAARQEVRELLAMIGLGRRSSGTGSPPATPHLDNERSARHSDG